MNVCKCFQSKIVKNSQKKLAKNKYCRNSIENINNNINIVY